MPACYEKHLSKEFAGVKPNISNRRHGFDLYCELPTRYGDFKAWVETQGEEDFIELMRYFFGKDQDFWGNIEHTLGPYDAGNILKYCIS